jgi:hypothetical protein
LRLQLQWLRKHWGLLGCNRHHQRWGDARTTLVHLGLRRRARQRWRNRNPSCPDALQHAVLASSFQYLR